MVGCVLGRMGNSTLRSGLEGASLEEAIVQVSRLGQSHQLVAGKEVWYWSS